MFFNMQHNMSYIVQTVYISNQINLFRGCRIDSWTNQNLYLKKTTINKLGQNLVMQRELSADDNIRQATRNVDVRGN